MRQRDKKGRMNIIDSLKNLWKIKKWRVVICSVIGILIINLTGVVIHVLIINNDRELNNETIEDNQIQKDVPLLLYTQLRYTKYNGKDIEDMYECNYYEDGTHIIFKDEVPYKAYNSCKFSGLFTPRLTEVEDELQKADSSSSKKIEANATDGQNDGEQYGLYKYAATVRYKYNMSNEQIRSYIIERVKAGADVLLIIEDYSSSEVYLKEVNSSIYRFIISNNDVVMGRYTKDIVPSIEEYCGNSLSELTDEEIEY